jgi:hypothetical protein
MSAMAVGNANFRGLLTHDRNWSRYGGASIPLSCDIGCGDIGEGASTELCSSNHQLGRIRGHDRCDLLSLANAKVTVTDAEIVVL